MRNLLVNTVFEKNHKHWKTENSHLESNVLSGDDYSGMLHEHLVVPIQSAYMRLDYKVISGKIQYVVFGIRYKDGVCDSCTSSKKQQLISMKLDIKDYSFDVFILVVSKTKNWSIQLNKIGLIDTDAASDYFIKADKTYIEYEPTRSYSNIYRDWALKYKSDFNQDKLLLNSKQGCCIKQEVGTSCYPLKFVPKQNHTYTIKVLIQELTAYGKITLRVGRYTSTLENNQLILTYTATGQSTPTLVLENKSLITYIINIKNILILDRTDNNIADDMIEYLSYVEGTV